MQFYLVAGLVRDLMVFHPVPHAHGAIPEREIYTILDGGGVDGVGHGAVVCGQPKLPDDATQLTRSVFRWESDRAD